MDKADENVIEVTLQRIGKEPRAVGLSLEDEIGLKGVTVKTWKRLLKEFNPGSERHMRLLKQAYPEESDMFGALLHIELARVDELHRRERQWDQRLLAFLRSVRSGVKRLYSTAKAKLRKPEPVPPVAPITEDMLAKAIREAVAPLALQISSIAERIGEIDDVLLEKNAAPPESPHPEAADLGSFTPMPVSFDA